MHRFGCTISTKCGFHVHVFAGDLSLDELRSLAINFVHCETAFDAIVPPSRRRDLNTYILSNRTAFGGNYDNDAINKAIDAYCAATTKEELIGVVSSAAPKQTYNGRVRFGYQVRYRKLNLQALHRYQTVEFRQHSGTVDADKVENWVRLCAAFVDRAKDSKPRKRPSTKAHVASQELSMLLRFVGADQSMRKFYQDRRRRLSDAALQRSAREAVAAGQVWMTPAE